MAKALSCGQLFRPLPGFRSGSRRPNAGIPNVGTNFPCAAGAALLRNRRRPPVVRSSLAEQSPLRQEEPQKAAEGGEEVDVEALEGLVQFLYEDLPHLFDDQGIDRTRYDDRVRFRDPITRHDTIDGYLFNIGLLRELFRPDFQLHHVKQVAFCCPLVVVCVFACVCGRWQDQVWTRSPLL